MSVPHTMTAVEHQQDILKKLTTLTGFVDRLDDVIKNMDLMKPQENLEKLENHILMIQGQKEFVKMALNKMKDEHGKS